MTQHHLPPAPGPLLRLAGLVLLLGLAACGGPPAPVTTPEVPGYDGPPQDLAGRDLGVLAGRRIVLDPGHGGHFRGALGPNGLTEAEVNLGVALHLRGLLEWAGAEVAMTRTADTDFLTPADSTLAGDLAMRVSLSDSLQPDVFLSIHHNSNAALDRTINETQTYYPLDDDGASLDLARSIHRQLVQVLGISPASIRPGNFHVLRHATVPAVLGEPAMISHPVMAERLTLAASQRLEASAYFLGLLDYFAAGLPRWSGAATDTVRFGGPDDPAHLAWTFVPDGPPGPDPASFTLRLDDRPAPAGIDGAARRITWSVPPDLSPVPHVIEVQGRNLAGRATPRRRTVLLPRAAAVPEVTILAAGDGSWGAHWRGRDGRPLPRGVLRLGGRTHAVAPDAPAWILVGDGTPPPDAAAFEPADTTVAVPAPLASTRLDAGLGLHLATLDGAPFAPADGWRNRLGPTSATPLLAVPDGGAVWVEGAGVHPLVDPAPRDPDAAARTVAGAAPEWPLAAVLPGLMGRTVVLDPAGGGTDTDGAGPLGLRGADLNLATARQAADLLRGAGATVILTRTDETAPAPPGKVRLAGRAGADYFITIARAVTGGERVVRHHPGSLTGAAWAAASTAALAALPAPLDSLAPPVRVEASSAYLLRHTACPALEWRLDAVADAGTEWRLGHPGWARAEARALLLALAALTAPGGEPESLDVPVALAAVARAGGPDPDDVTWARLDGNFSWAPLPPAPPVPAGPGAVSSGQGPGLPAAGPRHVLEVHTGTGWQLWLLERSAPDWQARPLLSGAPESP